VKRPRKRVTPRKGKPPRATKPPEKEAKKPSSERSKPGLSPEAWEKVGTVLPGVIRAVAVLIDAISRLK
jgi:hypothetical protein